MAKFVLIIFLSLALFQAKAQKANYTQAKKFIRPEIYSTQVKPAFINKSDRFWFSYQTLESIKYYLVDPEKKEKKELFDNEEFANQLFESTGLRLNPQRMVIPHFDFNDDRRTFSINLDRFRIEYDYNGHKVVKLDTLHPQQIVINNPQNTWYKYSPDSTHVIFARNHDLYLFDIKKQEENRLTEDGELFYSFAYVEHDTTSNTNMRTKAIWMNDSKKIYVSRSDNRRIEDMYLLNSLAPRPKAIKYKYMLPGDKEVVQYEVYVFDIETRKKTRIEIDKWKDQTVDVIYASPNSDFLYLLRKNRTANEMEFCVADVTTGKVEVLIHEKGEPYLNDQMLQFSILNGGKDIIWWSERTGWGNLYHYNDKGKLLNNITTGNWVAGKILRVDTVKRNIYFLGYGKKEGVNPYYTFLYKANIDKGKVTELTHEDANHHVSISPSGKYFIDNYSRVDLLPESVLKDINGKTVLKLATPDTRRLAETGWKMPERFVVKAKDGETDLHGVMWKPNDFDPSKKYPVITHVYPGPQGESIPLDFTVNGGFDGPLAQLGFVVVYFGNRGGSPVRSRAYHTYGYGNLRDYPLEDNKYGLEQLGERYSYIDLSRIGIFGHSGGGLMATAALCSYPDFYKVAVASAGNHDNRIFNKWWGETHQGVKEEQRTIMTPEGMKEDTVFFFNVKTNLELASKLEGHLLLAVGDMDDNVHPAQTYRMVDALIKSGKNFDFVLLPGLGHDFNGPGGWFFQFKMWFHFARYLLDDDSGNETVNFLNLGEK